MIKVITNLLAFVHLVAVGEALMLAQARRARSRQAYEAIRASSGNSFVHETESQVILAGATTSASRWTSPARTSASHWSSARDFGVPLELAALVERTFERARERYGGAAWSPMVVRLLEDALGTELRAAGFPASLQPRAIR